MNPSFTNIDMQIVKATVTKPTLQKITNDLTIDDFNPLKEDCWRKYRITVNGIYISSGQEEKIMTYIAQLIQNGVKKL
ncbi:MAG: hypothetical protein WCA39_00560 [Nitrososphaeraceae archaeon]|jgi:hypothetical protein